MANGCHAANGCHVANGCHLITLRLDTALIDDVGRGEVVDEVFLPSVSPGRLGRSLLGVVLPLPSSFARQGRLIS